jgi:Spy/CpxP family protein refolding chaperone
MKTKIITITLIFTFVLLSQIQAQPSKFAPKPFGGHGMLPMLNLTTEQMNAFNEMKLEFQKEILPLNNEIAAKRLELQSLLISGKPDQGKINDVIEELGELRTKAQKRWIAHQLEMREQLTDEQKAIWDAAPKGPKMDGSRKGHMGYRDQPEQPYSPLQGGHPHHGH